MAQFLGQLNSNEIFAAAYNMIISQQVFADNIAGVKSDLYEKAKVDGSLYGDQKLYYATDALKSVDWLNDAEAVNLLQLDRPPAPSVQAIVLNKFRQIRLTVDYYLSKRAWGTEGAFSQFTSVMLGWIATTKKIYNVTTYNAFIGTCKSAANKALLEVPLSDAAGDVEAQAKMIGQYLADLFVEMTDISRDFNDYKYLRSYNFSDIKVVWNSKFYNKITKVDLPTIFHKDGIIDKLNSDILPSRYFGEPNAQGGTTSSSNTTIRSLVEKDFGSTHVLPGDLLPNSTAYLAGETYTADEDIICKVYVKLPPFMSGFSVGTNFFNSRSLTENHYLTWGHNTLEILKNYPMVTVHAD